MSAKREPACCKDAITLQKQNKGVATERRIPGKMLGAAVAVPLRPASAAETESTAQSLSRACLLVGRDALVAGCLDWALLTTAEVGWAPHMQGAREKGCQNGFFQTVSPNFPFFFIATLFFFFHSVLLIGLNDKYRLKECEVCLPLPQVFNALNVEGATPFMFLQERSDTACAEVCCIAKPICNYRSIFPSFPIFCLY